MHDQKMIELCKVYDVTLIDGIIRKYKRFVVLNILLILINAYLFEICSTQTCVFNNHLDNANFISYPCVRIAHAV